jgi:TetR/AcrR family transcriptional regulator, tetracycline repressor protein
MRRRRGDNPLSRDEIVRAALSIVDKDGLEALTMRRLGDVLKVEAMSLYGHVSSKDDLLDQLADRVVEDVVVATSSHPIDAAIELAHGFRDALIAHPNLLPVLARRRTRQSDAGLTKREAALALARNAGLDADLAVIAYMTIVSFVVGHVITHAGVLSAGTRIDGPEPERAFEDGLAAVIEGLLSRAATSTTRA